MQQDAVLPLSVKLSSPGPSPNHLMQPDPNPAKHTASQPLGNPACFLGSPDAGFLSLARGDPALSSQENSPELAKKPQLPRSDPAPAARDSHAAASVEKQPCTSAQGAQGADSQWVAPPQTSSKLSPDVNTGKDQPGLLPVVKPHEPTWQEVLKGLSAVSKVAALTSLTPDPESEVMRTHREQVHAVCGGRKPGAEPSVPPDDDWWEQEYDHIEARSGLGTLGCNTQVKTLAAKTHQSACDSVVSWQHRINHNFTGCFLFTRALQLFTMMI